MAFPPKKGGKTPPPKGKGKQAPPKGKSKGKSVPPWQKKGGNGSSNGGNC